MRKIEKEMIAAVLAGKNWKNGNTAATRAGDGTMTVALHGNTILVIPPGSPHGPRVAYVTLAGKDTRATVSRVNALLRGLMADAGGYSHKRGQLIFTDARGVDLHARASEGFRVELALAPGGAA